MHDQSAASGASYREKDAGNGIWNFYFRADFSFSFCWRMEEICGKNAYNYIVLRSSSLEAVVQLECAEMREYFSNSGASE